MRLTLDWPRPADGSDPRPEYPDSEGIRWLRPAVCGKSKPPSVLMTRWSALLGLSSLARYHPKEWVRAIDPNQSTEAVVLDRALDAALEVLPGLILSAL